MPQKTMWSQAGDAGTITGGEPFVMIYEGDINGRREQIK
jgi:hypothetical protein